LFEGQLVLVDHRKFGEEPNSYKLEFSTVSVKNNNFSSILAGNLTDFDLAASNVDKLLLPISLMVFEFGGYIKIVKSL
jgi:hypothetical protein